VAARYQYPGHRWIDEPPKSGQLEGRALHGEAEGYAEMMSFALPQSATPHGLTGAVASEDARQPDHADGAPAA
jgi:hypothetical protein